MIFRYSLILSLFLGFFGSSSAQTTIYSIIECDTIAFEHYNFLLLKSDNRYYKVLTPKTNIELNVLGRDEAVINAKLKEIDSFKIGEFWTRLAFDELSVGNHFRWKIGDRIYGIEFFQFSKLVEVNDTLYMWK